MRDEFVVAAKDGAPDSRDIRVGLSLLACRWGVQNQAWSGRLGFSVNDRRWRRLQMHTRRQVVFKSRHADDRKSARSTCRAAVVSDARPVAIALAGRGAVYSQQKSSA
ncbi:MAG: hypothetical protein JO153_13430 [Solirubrobacterales bacterium]|nr:hypothetical protein [Solirubrobacterales bacterium]